MGQVWELITGATVAAPVWEIVLLLLCLSGCLLFRLNRAGLVVAYIFSLHMGWVFCQKDLLEKIPALEPYAALYFFFGAAVLFLAYMGMARSGGEEQ